MFNDLELTLNAQFYRLVDQVSDEDFRRLLDAASADAVGGELLANDFRIDALHPEQRFEFKYSLRVFTVERPVYFLAAEDRVDLLHAFILIIEVAGYVAILRKSCANIATQLERMTYRLSSDELSASLDDVLAFQKLSVRNMTISEAAVRARSYEAAELRGLLSTHAAGRSIPFFVRVRQRGGLSSLSLSSSRLFDSSERLNAHEVASWVRGKVARFGVPPRDDAFLASFAKSVELKSVLSVARPIALLIEAGALNQLLSSGNPGMYVLEGGVRRLIPGKLKARVLRSLERVYEIDEEDRFVGVRAKLKRNKASLSFQSRLLRRLHVEDEHGKFVTLQSFIIKEQLYSICFDNPKYMYYMGQCFEDSAGIAQLNELLDMLKPYRELADTATEKGDISVGRVNFSRNSVFGVVEGLHRTDDFIFCDDLGDEWADHIVLSREGPVIAFIHSKHGKKSTSASQLHDVVAQGVKNLGNMFFEPAAFRAKYDRKLSQVYDGTRISRLRKGRLNSLDNMLKLVRESYGVRRRCVLACDFISKADIAEQFDRIRRGEAVRGHVVQLVWILSSFSSATKELSVEPQIYCLP